MSARQGAGDCTLRDMAQPAPDQDDAPIALHRRDLDARRTELAMLLLEGALKLVRKEAQDAADKSAADNADSRGM